MSVFDDLPPHFDLTLQHQPHGVHQLAAGCKVDEIDALPAIAEIDPRSWVSVEQLQKAVDTNSFWIARWTAPDFSGMHMRAAADPEVLLQAISGKRSPSCLHERRET